MIGTLALRPENNSAYNTLCDLRGRNQKARDAIKKYANRHAAMDVAIGAAGFFGLAIPALMAAIAAQAPVIYQPLARELANIYNSPVDDETGTIVLENLVFTGAADIAGDFGVEFITSIAGELIGEVGAGTIIGFIPIVGGIFGAGLDYVIATAMTWRVGTMVATYYQNGGRWVRDKKHTLELAREMMGGLSFGMSDLVARFTGQNRQQIELDLNSIPERVPEVFKSQVRNLRSFASMMLKALSRSQVRSLLEGQGVPLLVIDAVLNAAGVGKA